MTDGQGFYIYRNRRLICWGDWQGCERKGMITKLCRVRIDIPNSVDDFWELDIKKSRAKPPKAVIKRLKEYLSEWLETSKQISTNPGRTRFNKELVNRISLWTGRDLPGNRFFVSINEENPLLQNLLMKLNETQQKDLKIYLKLLETTYPTKLVISGYQDDKTFGSKESKEQELEELLSIFRLTADGYGTEVEKKQFLKDYCSYPEVNDCCRSIRETAEDLLDSSAK